MQTLRVRKDRLCVLPFFSVICLTSNCLASPTDLVRASNRCHYVAVTVTRLTCFYRPRSPRHLADLKLPDRRHCCNEESFEVRGIVVRGWFTLVNIRARFRSE